MSYSAYWQAQANRCTGFADEGACLERVARHAGGLTIVPGFGGLGQTDEILTYSAGSAEIRALQTALMSAGALGIRTADGRIDADSSPTLAAIRAWATSRGLPTTGIGRASGGGLSVPASIVASILGGGAAPPATPAATIPTKSPPSAVLPEPSLVTSTGRWAPWWIVFGVGGAATVALLYAVARR